LRYARVLRSCYRCRIDLPPIVLPCDLERGDWGSDSNGRIVGSSN
jgi:hypothetical protein